MSLFYPRIFLHFFDIHFLRQKGFLHPHEKIVEECRIATRLAICLADKVIIPAASYVESLICRNIIHECIELLPLGVIEITGNANHISHFREKKITEYPERSAQHEIYLGLNPDLVTPPFIKRTRSATSDIVDYWLDTLESGPSISHLSDKTRLLIPKDFENKWAVIPELLEDKAFIVEHVQRFIGPIGRHPDVENYLHTVINQGYFSSYTRDFGAGIITELVYLDAGYAIESSGPNIPYRKVIQILQKRGLLHQFATCPPVQLLGLKNELVWYSAFEKAIIPELIQPHDRSHFIYSASNSQGESKNMKPLKTFIVHGHNHKLLYELKDFLQNTLRLPEPVILAQQPSIGRTIIEKFEDITDQVDVAFIVLTPDDLTVTNDAQKQQRARQNVIFELGYFVGKFGRRSGRVILLHVGPLELPSDLQGIVYVDVSNGISSAGENLRKELQTIGANL